MPRALCQLGGSKESSLERTLSAWETQSHLVTSHGFLDLLLITHHLSFNRSGNSPDTPNVAHLPEMLVAILQVWVTHALEAIDFLLFRK